MPSWKEGDPGRGCGGFGPQLGYPVKARTRPSVKRRESPAEKLVAPGRETCPIGGLGGNLSTSTYTLISLPLLAYSFSILGG